MPGCTLPAALAGALKRRRLPGWASATGFTPSALAFARTGSFQVFSRSAGACPWQAAAAAAYLYLRRVRPIPPRQARISPFGAEQRPNFL